ncbi:MAG TPA: BatD family protein [Candidatus Acidoferrales bacterium]|nr:BatD family protein [Candidatus Acidoferrales bacterium]
MRFILKIWFALAIAALVEGAAFAATFTASLDRDSITLGDSATLSLTFEGAQPRNVPTPNVSGLQISQTGNSQNFSIVNGAMSSTVTVSFSVTSQNPGEYTIPALTAEVGGQQLSTQPLKLTVTKASAPTAEAVNSGNEVAFMKLGFPKQKIYVGESAVLHLDLYLRDDVQNFGNFQLTSALTEGFSAGKLAELPNQRHRVQVGNRVYTIIPFAMPITAVKTGPYTLGPFTANVVVVLPGGFFGEQRQATLATESANVEAVPLPEDNKPAGFAGAIGSFTMTATAGPTTVTVGDPITVRVKISGQGSLDSLMLPTQDAWQNFKAYPPTSKVEASDQFGLQGTKTFEQIISPLNTDVHELPPLHFTFFNPDDGQYHSLKSVASPLTVQAAGATPMPALAATKNPAPENQSPQDILPIKEKPGVLAPAGTPLIGRPVFLAAQTVPVLAFLAAFVWRRRTDNLANNPRLRRRLAVAQLVAAGIADLKKYATANQPDEFFATLFRLLQEQLGERLDCPASAITENVIEEHPVLRGAPKATLDGLSELFQLCNQARYAPVRGSSELNLVAAQFEKTISQLQEVKA